MHTKGFNSCNRNVTLSFSGEEYRTVFLLKGAQCKQICSTDSFSKWWKYSALKKVFVSFLMTDQKNFRQPLVLKCWFYLLREKVIAPFVKSRDGLSVINHICFGKLRLIISSHTQAWLLPYLFNKLSHKASFHDLKKLNSRLETKPLTPVSLERVTENPARAIIHKWRTFSKSVSTYHRGGHRRIQNNI